MQLNSVKELEIRMLMKRKIPNKLQWLLYYSVTFTITCLFIYMLQIFYNRSFIYTQSGIGDGLLQHYTVLMYYGKWLRSILSNIFIKHRFSIQNWDMSIGLGADVASTFHYYGLGDPLNLLAVFVPAVHTEALYNFLVLFRLYLAGVTFWIYCRNHGYRNAMVLPGAVIYVFSFYTITLSVLHPFFLNPLIYFPLVLLGIDFFMEKGKISVFIISCMMAAYANFYFFYMMSIFMVLYAVIRYITLFAAERSVKHLMRMIAKVVCCYLGAVTAALPVLLPSAAVVLSGERTGSGVEVPVFYEPAYYLKLIIAFVNASADHYAALGYTSVGLLAVIMLFFCTGKKEKLPLKTAFVLGTVFLMIPFCGHVLNGFGYAVNRWVWAYDFVAALIVVDRMPQIVENVGKTAWIVLAGMLVFALPTFGYRTVGDRKKIMVSAALLVCAGMAALLWTVAVTWKRRKASMPMFLGMIIMNLFLNAFSFYSPYGGNDIENHGKAGQAYAERMDGFYRLLDEAEIDRADVRIDTVHMGFGGAQVNGAMLHQSYGTSFYFSMNDSSASSFIRDMELPVSTDISYTDMDARSFVEAQLGCRYCVVRKGDEMYLPYGYDKQVVSGDGYAVYESAFALPLVYSYDSYLDQDNYDSLTAVQKQQATLKTCVLEGHADGIRKEEAQCLEFTDRRIAAVVDACTEGIEVDGNRIIVSKEGASLYISADEAECTERYLAFQNLWYDGDGAGISNITVTDGQRQMQFQVRSPSNVQYSDIHDLMCNLGYRENHSTEYTVTFGSAGTYSYDGMEIVDQPVDDLAELTKQRRRDSIRYTIGEDVVVMDVQLDAPRIVYAAVPYSKRWKVYVNGRRAECARANGFGIGVCVEAGIHRIELRYESCNAAALWNGKWNQRK